MKRRYVVQRHSVPDGSVHYDFMVERGDKLATWKLDSPLPCPGTVPGERTFDHRAIYLEFEGEISGGRGRVSIVEKGELVDREGDPDAPRYIFGIGDRSFELVATGERVRIVGSPG
jgi:hypothetical protein